MNRQSVWKYFITIAAVLGVVLPMTKPAAALPSYARQTGLPCSRCHITFPELTEFGREFKLNGYVLSGQKTGKVTAPSSKKESGLWINQNLPLSAMFQISDTVVQQAQPGTQNGNIEFPQQMSLFLAGQITTHIGSFMQATYTPANDHFSMDNTDIRYANFGSLGGKQLVYGLDLNNNPTVEDLWNDTPAWGWPFVSPDSAPGPMASPLLLGGLAQDVGGLGAYALWNHHWYGDATAYRSMHIGGPQPPVGTGFGINIAGVAPYWRGAYQTSWSGVNYLEVGTLGMHVNSYPNTIGGVEDHITDTGADAQYDRHFGVNELTAHLLYLHEKSQLDATLANAGASFSSHKLDSLNANAIYHLGNRYSFGAGPFWTWGTADPLLYAQSPVSGSANGSPNSDGYLLQAGYWPAQNVEFSVAYQGFLKFNGGTTNYDGAGRNASQNNTVYVNLWLMF